MSRDMTDVVQDVISAAIQEATQKIKSQHARIESLEAENASLLERMKAETEKADARFDYAKELEGHLDMLREAHEKQVAFLMAENTELRDRLEWLFGEPGEAIVDPRVTVKRVYEIWCERESLTWHQALDAARKEGTP